MASWYLIMERNEQMSENSKKISTSTSSLQASVNTDEHETMTVSQSYRCYWPLFLNELFCWVKLLAELLHLLVVAETLFIILVELQTLSDVAAKGTKLADDGAKTTRQNRGEKRPRVCGSAVGARLTWVTRGALRGCSATCWASGKLRGCRCAASLSAWDPGWPSVDPPFGCNILHEAPGTLDPKERSEE